MRVAASAHAASLEAAVAPRFGRAPGFLIVDPKTMAFEYVANGANADRATGLGADAAALIAKAGVTVLLTGFVGAKAMRALAEAGIRVADGLGALTVREAMECLVRGEITPILPEDVASGRAAAPPDEKPS
jgi:predicted Fe-Mo cluster-binding NifX family protein